MTVWDPEKRHINFSKSFFFPVSLSVFVSSPPRCRTLFPSSADPLLALQSCACQAWWLSQNAFALQSVSSKLVRQVFAPARSEILPQLTVEGQVIHPRLSSWPAAWYEGEYCQRKREEFLSPLPPPLCSLPQTKQAILFNSIGQP